MLKHLVLIMLKSMFAGMFSRNKKKTSKGKMVLFTLLGIYLIAVFGMLFGGMFVSICKPFVAMGYGWLYFGFMGIMVFLLCFIGSVFVTQNQIYEAKDNDLLLSMPVPARYILAARIVALAALNYVYELLVVLPGAAVYGYIIGFTALQFILFLIAFILLPLLVMAVSALFGWLIALANTRMRNKNVVMMVLTLALFLGYMYVCMQLQEYLQMLVANGEAIGDAIQKALPPFYHLGVAISEGSLGSFGIYLLFCIVPFVAIYYILSKSFIKIATTNRGRRKIEYKEKSLKASGTMQALVGKEMGHFLGSPMYMFNAGIGLVFMIIGAIYVLIKGDMITGTLAMMGMDSNIIGPAMCMGFGAMASLTIISAPSISIEAKTLWISQSMPIRPRDAIMAKAHMHTVSSLPFIIVSAVLVQLAFADLSIISRIMIFAFPIAVTVFNAFTGVFLNLKYPKFDWINEANAVKQGAAPFLAMLVAMATIAVPFILYVWKLRDVIVADYYICIVFGLFVIGALLLYRYLTTKGEEMYMTLQN